MNACHACLDINDGELACDPAPCRICADHTATNPPVWWRARQGCVSLLQLQLEPSLDSRGGLNQPFSSAQRALPPLCLLAQCAPRPQLSRSPSPPSTDVIPADRPRQTLANPPCQRDSSCSRQRRPNSGAHRLRIILIPQWRRSKGRGARPPRWTPRAETTRSPRLSTERHPRVELARRRRQSQAATIQAMDRAICACPATARWTS